MTKQGPQSRRFKVIAISNKDMMRLITGEIKITGIPEYTRLCEVYPHFMGRGWDILIEHPSFPEVNEAVECERENIEFELVDKPNGRKLFFD